MTKKISNDFCVLCKIYELTEIQEETAYFSKLVQNLDLEKKYISRAVDKLFDLGIIYGDWEKVEGYWTRTFNIEPDALPLAKQIYSNQYSTKGETEQEDDLSM